MELDIKLLENTWQQKWAACPPLADELKNVYGNKWLRLYSLPDAKRYPENKEELATLTLRHNAVLDEISASKTINVILASWSNTQDASAPNWPEGYQASNHLQYWQTIDEDPEENDVEFKSYRHLFIYKLEWHSGVLNELFQYVSEDKLAGVIIAPDDLSWLYHPYDGGADVFFAVDSEKDRVHDKYKEWTDL